MRLVIAVILVVTACGGTADGPSQTASADSANWVEFNRHLAASTDEVGSIKDGFGRIETFDPLAIDAQAMKLQLWAASEQEWLDAHPSDPCYAETHTSWSAGVALYREAATLYRVVIGTNDSGLLGQATETMTKGDDEFRKGLASIPVSKDDCAI